MFSLSCCIFETPSAVLLLRSFVFGELPWDDDFLETALLRRTLSARMPQTCCLMLTIESTTFVRVFSIHNWELETRSISWRSVSRFSVGDRIGVIFTNLLAAADEISPIVVLSCSFTVNLLLLLGSSYGGMVSYQLHGVSASLSMLLTAVPIIS